MAGIRCSTRELATLVVAGVLALLLAVGAAGSARATAEDASELELSRVSGPPGTEVVVESGSFGKCTNSPRVNLLIDQRAVGGTVAVYWDGKDKKVEQVVESDGSISMAFRVPETAPGEYDVVARCVDDEDIEDSASFQVTPKPVAVPGLAGMDRDEAERTLVGDGLVLGKTSGNGETVESQSPSAGTMVEPGTPVDVDFGTAPLPAVVPNVVRLSRAQAVAALESAGLRLGRVSGRGGVVRGQSPEPGTTVRRGSPVDITVGSVTRLVTVPRVIGLTPEDAASVLTDRRLVLGQVSGDGEKIRGQRPRPGTRVPAGSAVNVTVERDVVVPVLIAVPNLVGRKVAAARVALTDLGLMLGGAPSGDRTVARQQPAAGTLVAAGKVVTVTLAAPPMIRVPDLVGGNAARARTALSAVGLVLGGTSDSDRDIVGQQPAAGTLVLAGSTVTPTFAQSSSPWPAVAVLSALLLGSAVATYRVVKQQLDQQWISNRLRIVARQSAAVPPRITESNRSAPMPVVRIEPHADPGTHILEEV